MVCDIVSNIIIGIFILTIPISNIYFIVYLNSNYSILSVGNFNIGIIQAIIVHFLIYILISIEYFGYKNKYSNVSTFISFLSFFININIDFALRPSEKQYYITLHSEQYDNFLVCMVLQFIYFILLFICTAISEHNKRQAQLISYTPI